MVKKIYYTILIIASIVHEMLTQETDTARLILVEQPEDAKLNFTQLAEKYGHKAEEHEIVTADGYILLTFRILGDTSRPLLMNHELLGSADDFIIRGSRSLAITLADAGYDVWAMNVRGNRFSRKHVKLNPDKDRCFWDFSIDEMGYFDIPANIDYILNVTGQPKLSLLGFSQGTTTTFILGTSRPEYNNKIKIFVALAPIVFLEHTEGVNKYLIEFSPVIGTVGDILHIDEVFGYNSTSRLVFQIICTKLLISSELCAKVVLTQIANEKPTEGEKEFFDVAVAHFPAGTSRMNLVHFGQIGRNKAFARYDYGKLGNLKKYNSSTPPEYNLDNFSVASVFVEGLNDDTSTIKDVALLKSKLKCVKSELIITTEKFNHLDHIWGKNIYNLSFPFILSELAKNYEC